MQWLIRRSVMYSVYKILCSSRNYLYLPCERDFFWDSSTPWKVHKNIMEIPSVGGVCTRLSARIPWVALPLTSTVGVLGHAHICSCNLQLINVFDWTWMMHCFHCLCLSKCIVLTPLWLSLIPTFVWHLSL